jgi:hypothetical protein
LVSNQWFHSSLGSEIHFFKDFFPEKYDLYIHVSIISQNKTIMFLQYYSIFNTKVQAAKQVVDKCGQVLYLHV